MADREDRDGERGPAPFCTQAPDPSTHRFEMTIGRGDFLRLLPVAVGGEPFTVAGNEIVASEGRSPWRIRLEERPGRRFGPVELPVLDVRLELAAATAGEAQAFVGRFLRGFQRAGG